MAIIKKNGNYMSLPKGYRRGNPIPLDITDIWYSYDELVTYATTNPIAYVGQRVAVVDEKNETAKAYIILNTKGDLKEIGVGENDIISISADGVSVVIDNNKLAMNNYGKRYYRYINGNYVLQEVNANFPWKAGLEPKVSLENEMLVLGWYEPNPTTVEGINSQLTALQENVEENKTEITKLKTNVSNITDALNLYVKQVEYQKQLATINTDIEELKKRTTWNNL